MIMFKMLYFRFLYSTSKFLSLLESRDLLSLEVETWAEVAEVAKAKNMLDSVLN